MVPEPLNTTELILIPFANEILAISRGDLEKARALGREMLSPAQSSAQPGSEPEKLMDAEGANAISNVPASWFLEQARQNKIPHLKFGKYIRFRFSDVMRSLEVRPGHTA